jgi:hypothetical protein
LQPPGDHVIHAGTTLIVTNEVTDPDTPPSFLRFSLPSGPMGATLDPVTGVFQWTPAFDAALSTNQVVVRVTDDGLPPLSDENDFQIVVLPTPMLGGITIDQSRVEFSWIAAPGTRYRILYTENLTAPVWTNLTGDITATGSVVTVTDDTGPAPQRFYRIQIVP